MSVSIHKGSVGSVKLFGKNYTDPDVRAKVGVLIETPGCFTNMSIWDASSGKFRY